MLLIEFPVADPAGSHLLTSDDIIINQPFLSALSAWRYLTNMFVNLTPTIRASVTGVKRFPDVNIIHTREIRDVSQGSSVSVNDKLWSEPGLSVSS